MPDGTSQIWVDSTFTASDEDQKDVPVVIQLADSDNIGGYSIPVVFSVEEVDQQVVNTQIEYFNVIDTVSGSKDVPNEYYLYELPKVDDMIVSLVEFGLNNTLNYNRDNIVVYSTGYNAISGSLNSRVTYIGGNRFYYNYDISNSYWNYVALSGIINKEVNYVNFSGNLTTSGTPIPFYISNRDYLTEYGVDADDMYTTALSKIVEIFFAGWVNFTITSDIYSSLLSIDKYYTTDITTISGNVNVHYLDVFSSELVNSGINYDIYCSLLSLLDIPIDVELTPGRIGYLSNDIYSTVEAENYLTMDIGLYSLKITNFSLDIDEYTTASDYVYVDVVDDVCAVSVSGTYFLIDGEEVYTTFSGIGDGYRIFYNLEDGLNFLDGPKIFTIHAENECGKSLEQNFYLTFGYIVEYENTKELTDGIDYGYGNKVAVRVTAENYASCPRTSTFAWEFESRSEFNCDLGASIVGRFQGWNNSNMPATIYPLSTAYFYGKEFRVTINAKDFAGNQMEPFILVYRIEDKP